MLRQGYSGAQIYDVLTGAGLRGEMVQLIIDRVLSEMPEGREGKPKLLAELEGIRAALEELRGEMSFLRRAIQLSALPPRGGNSCTDHAPAYKR